MKIKYFALLAAIALPVSAADQSTAPLPAEDSMEPEVVISPSKDEQIREYRVNGQLYMIEITPIKGPVYYLVDMDGDGLLDTRQGGTENELVIPRWTLLKW